jgi:DNA-binding response OmpR family regulator
LTIAESPPRVRTSLPQSFTVCVSSSSEERGRLAAALDGQGLVLMVPDAQMAIDLLTRAADPDSVEDSDGIVRLSRLEIDRQRATVRWAAAPLLVSHLELEVLACLAATPGAVWTYERLHEVAWGSRYVGDRDSVYSLVKRLRRKLTEAGVTLDLHAVRGIGFQLLPSAAGWSPDTAVLSSWDDEVD